MNGIDNNFSLAHDKPIPEIHFRKFRSFTANKDRRQKPKEL